MPHVCGDEPAERMIAALEVCVCPTYVGMNRPLCLSLSCRMGMPHVCGDEPGVAKATVFHPLYAPRMWG